MWLILFILCTILSFWISATIGVIIGGILLAVVLRYFILELIRGTMDWGALITMMILVLFIVLLI